jgi:glycosyltransferase involved in cell wall biosynthesis
MRIGIDCRLPYYQMGGISQYITHLITSLADIDRDSSYELFHSKKDANSYIPNGTTNFERTDLFTPCHHRFERWTLGAELLRHRPDVFHSPDFIPPAYGAANRVITVHDLNFWYYPEFLTKESRRYYLDQIEWAVRVADHIIADSDHTRNDLMRILGVADDKVSTVYLAANPLYSMPRATDEIDSVLQQFELPAGFILFVGTLSPRKNVILLLSAYEILLKSSKTETPLVLVGATGWLSDEIFDTISRLNLGSQVLHLEGVSDYELSCLYPAAGLLALPSYYEGFGLPPLEAMHSGCPVVSSNRGSLPEIVGDAGPLIDPENLDGWVSSMEILLKDEGARETARTKGYAQAKRFSWENTARETLEIYRNLAED